MCPYCKMKKSKTTRHCVICKICVKAHDHHCKWINNCIGRANYRVFISFLVFLIISVVCDTSILILHLQNQLETYGILSQYSGTFIEIACLIMNSGILIIVLPIVYKQVKGYQRPKSRPQKCYKVKSTDLSKILQTRTIDSTSDTDSMFIRDSYDSNSEISSKTSSLSQLFPSS